MPWDPGDCGRVERESSRPQSPQSPGLSLSLSGPCSGSCSEARTSVSKEASTVQETQIITRTFLRPRASASTCALGRE